MISLYFGRPGGGKSYQVVQSVVVPAIARGRDVYTNIAGLQIDKIIEYIKINYNKIDFEDKYKMPDNLDNYNFGNIIYFDKKDYNDKFFPKWEEDKQIEVKEDIKKDVSVPVVPVVVPVANISISEVETKENLLKQLSEKNDNLSKESLKPKPSSMLINLYKDQIIEIEKKIAEIDLQNENNDNKKINHDSNNDTKNENNNIQENQSILINDTKNENNNNQKINHDSNNDTFCKAGSIIIIDECWEYFPSQRLKIDDEYSREHLEFTRHHRHCSGSYNGITYATDLVLITQDYKDIHAKVRSLIEMYIETTKHVAFGSRSSYTLNFYYPVGGDKEKKAYRTDIKKYDKKVFELYQSYSSAGGSAVEISTDSRLNFFNNKKYIYYVIFFILMSFIMGFVLYNRLKNPAGSKDVKQDSKDVKQDSKKTQNTSNLNYSTEYQLVGYYQLNETTYAVLRSSDGRLRYLINPAGHFDGHRTVVNYQGKTVASFSGSVPQVESSQFQQKAITPVNPASPASSINNQIPGASTK